MKVQKSRLRAVMLRSDLAIAMISCIPGKAYECPEKLSDLQQWGELTADRMCECRQTPLLFTLPTVTFCGSRDHWKFSLSFHAESEGNCPYQTCFKAQCFIFGCKCWYWLSEIRCVAIWAAVAETLYCLPRNDCFSGMLLIASQTAPMSHLGCSLMLHIASHQELCLLPLREGEPV